MLFRYGFLPIVYCFMILTSCGQHTQSSSTASADSTIVESDASPVGNFYKRFSGTIGGRQVILHLHRYGGAVHGNYQYTSIGQTIGLRNWEDSVQDDQFYLVETPTNEPGSTDTPAHWTITVHGHSATGVWTSANGSSGYPIDLREEYPVGTTQLQAAYMADSAGLLANRSSPKATKSYSYLLPRDNTNQFLIKELTRIIVQDASGNTDVRSLLAHHMQSYLADYKKENVALASKEDGLESFTLNYTSDEVVSVLYNDDGFLVVEDQNSDYTGGMHGNYGSSFSNIDVQDQRIWKITDMVTDTAALRPMLNDAAIAYFKLKPGEGMDQRMLVDEVPPTANVYLSNTGLTFVYNPYEIASYADGQVCLFLPFKKILSFLTPSFRSRMKLTDRAGVAMLAIRFN